MTELELFNIIRPVILSVTGVPEVILANPNIPAPAGEYAAVLPKQSVSQRGQANIYGSNSVATNTVDVDVRAQAVAECSVNFYRGDAPYRAELLQQANKRPSVSSALFKAGVGWQRTGAVNNLRFLQADNWENRAQISMYLMYEETVHDIVNSIESVQVVVEDSATNELADFEVLSPDSPL